MQRLTIAICAVLLTSSFQEPGEKKANYPTFDTEVARQHQVKPRRRAIPLHGVRGGFNQLRLRLIVSPSGDVVSAEASGNPATLAFWPQVKSEVTQWKYTPFEKNGTPVTAEIEEYLDLLPPERLPSVHVPAPSIQPDSKIVMKLQRTGCFGSCPSYAVTVTTEGIVFDGGSYVAATGRHTATVESDVVRSLAQEFVNADFYSMDSSYEASVTDNPTYVLSITIDGHTKEVVDYVGSWVGMPAVITELEDKVDRFARAERWITGSDGLVQALRDAGFNFNSFEAQVIVKESSSRGRTQTVREFLAAGVPLDPLPPPKPKNDDSEFVRPEGWLRAASRHPETLKVLIQAGASKNDQGDKDQALAGAASSGKLEGARALIAYGANPNSDLRKLIVTENSGGMTLGTPGAGSILIYAARSGNPEIVREILKYRPNLEARDHQGRTAIFAAGEYRYGDEDGARVECVRLLAQAGTNVNARDNEGNTPLHESFLTDVLRELLKFGADVNARNHEGETPIFVTVSEGAVSLFLEHGADPKIRNNEGKTVLEAVEERGRYWKEVVQKALQASKKVPQ